MWIVLFKFNRASYMPEVVHAHEYLKILWTNSLSNPFSHPVLRLSLCYRVAQINGLKKSLLLKIYLVELNKIQRNPKREVFCPSPKQAV